MLKIFLKFIFKVLTAISCPLEALDRFLQCLLCNLLHLESNCLYHRTPKVLVNLKMEIKSLIKVTKAQSRSQKKLELLLENKLFVPWVSFDCK